MTRGRGRVDAVETRLDAVEMRLARIEGRARGRTKGPSAAPSGEEAVTYAQALSRRTGRKFTQGGSTAAIGFAGAVAVDDRKYMWAREVGVAQLLDAPPATVARWLGAIASPPRIALVLALLGRDRTSTELTTVLGDVSAGQVYHHLKELQAVGILVQVGRGVYRIAPPILIPLLVALAAATDACGSAPTADLEPFSASASQPS